MSVIHKRVLEYRHVATDWGRYYKVEPALILAVIHQESGGHPYIRSFAGAVGLMQILHAHKDYNRDAETDYVLPELYDPVKNIRIGTWYLRWCLNRTTTEFDALRAYNAGIGTIRRGDERAGKGYAESVLTLKQRYEIELNKP